jgi:hypothetical protein
MTRIESKVYSTFALAAGIALGVAVGVGMANAAVVAPPTVAPPTVAPPIVAPPAVAAPPVWFATPVTPSTATTAPAPAWYATSVATIAAGATVVSVPPRAGWPFLTPQHRTHGGHAAHRR